MASIFSDGFESGDLSAWSWTVVNGTGASLTVSTAAERSGTYGLIAEGNTGGQNWNAYVVRSFTAPSSNIYHCRFYLNVQAANTGGGLRVLRLNGSGVFNLFRLSDYYGQWRVFIRRRDGNNEEIDISASASSTWVRVDVLYNITGANPICKVWIDSTLVVDFTDTTSGSTAMPNELQIGGAEESWSQTATLWIDDVASWDDAANIPSAGTNHEGAAVIRARAHIAGLARLTFALAAQVRAASRVQPQQALRIGAASAVRASVRISDAPALTVRSASVVRASGRTPARAALTFGASSLVRGTSRIAPLPALRVAGASIVRAQSRLSAPPALSIASASRMGAAARMAAQPSQVATGEAAIIISRARIMAGASLTLRSASVVRSASRLQPAGALVFALPATVRASSRMTGLGAMVFASGAAVRSGARTSAQPAMLMSAAATITARARMGNMPALIIVASAVSRARLRILADSIAAIEFVDDIGLVSGIDYTHGARMGARRGTSTQSRRGAALQTRGVR